jgi:hypothetical protein
MASHKLTGLSAGTTAGDSVEYGGSPSFTNLAYTGTLTGSTGILNIGSGQVYKDASGNVGIGTSSPSFKLDIISSANSTIGTRVYNTNTGSAAFAALSLGNDTGNVQGLYLNSSTNTSYAGANSLSLIQVGAYPIGFVTNNIERMRIDSSGNLLVGTTSTAITTQGIAIIPTTDSLIRIAHISGTPSNSIYVQFGYNATSIGSITQNGTTGVAYNTSSDQRLKENIVDAPSALDSVNSIKVRSFDWKSDGTHVDYGYIAQELLEVAPEAVAVPEDEDQMMGVDFGKLTPRLVKAIQELKAIIDTQQEQINSLLGK